MHNAEPVENQVLSQICEDMRVVDVNGNEVGKVDHIKMGQPSAATTQGNDPQPGLLGQVVNLVLDDQPEPDVHEPFRSRLLRSGYVKVDGPGLNGTDSYVSPDAVARISNDTVHLSVKRDDLLREA